MTESLISESVLAWLSSAVGGLPRPRQSRFSLLVLELCVCEYYLYVAGSFSAMIGFTRNYLYSWVNFSFTGGDGVMWQGGTGTLIKSPKI